MKKFLFLFFCLLSVNLQAQIYHFGNQNNKMGVIRMGEEVNLNDNDNQIFSFCYQPKVGDTYLSVLTVILYASDENINSLIKYPVKELKTFNIILVNGDVISLSSNHWKDNTPLTATYIDNAAMLIPMGFIDAELNGQSLTITSKTKEKEKLKWIGQIKSELQSIDIKAIEIEAICKDSTNDKEEKKNLKYDITKPTTYIFKSLMYDEINSKK